MSVEVWVFGLIAEVTFQNRSLFQGTECPSHSALPQFGMQTVGLLQRMRASPVWGHASPSSEGPHSCPLLVLVREHYPEGDSYEQNEDGPPLPWNLNEGEEFLRHPEAKAQLVIEVEDTRAFHISVAVHIGVLL